jgi:hypothetical protein
MLANLFHLSMPSMSFHAYTDREKSKHLIGLLHNFPFWLVGIQHSVMGTRGV